ncbi:MAG: hypothetical protein ACXV4A_09665 [Actinomycetes bacterium]
MGTETAPDHEQAPHDAAHLDEDAECLEDPVHCGDAQHQHAARATKAPPATAPAGNKPAADGPAQPA